MQAVFQKKYLIFDRKLNVICIEKFIFSVSGIFIHTKTSDLKIDPLHRKVAVGTLPFGFVCERTFIYFEVLDLQFVEISGEQVI